MLQAWDRMENCAEEKDLKLLLNSWQCAQVARKTNGILTRTRNGVINREVIVPLYWALVRLHLKCSVLGFSLQEKQWGPEAYAEKGDKALRGPEHKSYEEQLR